MQLFNFTNHPNLNQPRTWWRWSDGHRGSMDLTRATFGKIGSRRDTPQVTRAASSLS